MERIDAENSGTADAASVRPAEPTTAAQRDRRARIVRAAMDLLADHGYDEIQMRDVAVGAGVALGTLYRYFPSKEQLFAHVLLEWSASFDEAVRRRRPSRGTDAERLRTLLRRAVGAFERHPNYFQLLGVLEGAKDPAVVEPFAEYSRRFMDALADALTDTDPEDVEVVTTLSTSLLSTLLRGWSIGHRSIRDVEAQIDQAVEVMFEGVRRR
jgi:AcrR family transcriptional regulator